MWTSIQTLAPFLEMIEAEKEDQVTEMTPPPRRHFSRRGVELMVAIIVASIFCLLSGPYLYRLYRRERLRMAAQEISRVIAAARLKAVKSNAQVVLQIDAERREARVWIDDPKSNFLQDSGETTVLAVRLRSGVFFRYAPNGDRVNGPDAVAFDTYRGNPELVDRVVFTPDGALVPPESSWSKAPARPVAGNAAIPHGSINCGKAEACRGVYVSDRPGGGPAANRNTFRVSVNDFGPSGRVTILKWLPLSEGGNPGESDYVPSPWKWVD
jgi:Tfp pilus assembly protein FimT